LQSRLDVITPSAIIQLRTKFGRLMHNHMPKTAKRSI